jgi:hypothetical protein
MQYSVPDFRSKVKAGQQILVAGAAFGVGSSREQAPRALKGKNSTKSSQSLKRGSQLPKLAGPSKFGRN